jgi:hypothetical protein
MVEFSNLCFTPNITQLLRIEKAQKQITRFIAYKCNFQYISYNDRLTRFSLDSLQKRRGTIFKNHL